MNEVLMALLSFGLGVLATLLAQIFARRLKLSDAKRQQQFNDLLQVKSWIESYRILFECKYPEVRLDKFVGGKPSEDKSDSLFAYQALKLFREASAKCDEAARVGRLALKFLTPQSWADPISLHLGAFLGRIELFHVSLLAWLRMPVKIFSIMRKRPETPSIPYEYRRGLPKVIYPLIQAIEERRDDLFVRYPQQWYQTDWDKLDFIEPSDMHLIVHHSGNWPRREEFGSFEEFQYMLEQAHRSLRIHPDNLRRIRQGAQYKIERALEEIHKCERKLLVVPSESTS